MPGKYEPEIVGVAFTEVSFLTAAGFVTVSLDAALSGMFRMVLYFEVLSTN